MEHTHNMTDYESTYANFKWAVPEYYNFATDVIDQWAKDPSHLAMWWIDDQGHEIKKTFLDFSLATKKVANLLASQGVKKGDVVVILLPRCIEWWETFVGCLRLGAIAAPGTTQLTPKDIEYRVQTSGAVCLITDDANASKVDEIAENCPVLQRKITVGSPRPGWIDYHEALAGASADFEPVPTKSDDNAIIYFTSGTVGYPKMTLHTHTSYPLGHLVTGKYWLDLKPDDLHWNLSDTGWAKAAWSSLFGPWQCGAALFVHHSSRFDPARTLEILQNYPITTLCGAPTNYRMMVLEDLDRYTFPTLRHCVGAGEPLNPEVIEVWKKATGLTIRDGYGQTETVVICGNFPVIEPRFGSMGKPTPGFDLQIVDDEGNILPNNTEGNVAVRVKPERPLGLFKEYWKDPERTASCFIGDWYLTGDKAYRDDDGYFWFVGRADDVILTAGYRVGPFEVESALIEHPAVAESAVVSSPDEVRGEIIKAFIILAPGYEPGEELAKEIQEFVKNSTAPYKYPRKIEFVDSLPKTISGKIRRIELREREWNK